MTRRSRRGVLRAGGRSLAVALAAGLAGCNAFGGDGSGTRTTFGVPPRSDAAGGADGTTGATGTTTGRSRTTGRTATGASPGRVEFASLSLPEPVHPTYRQWLPAPSRLYSGLAGGPPGAAVGDGSPAYRLGYARPFWMEAFAPAVPAAYDGHRRSLKPGLDHFGVGFENYEWVLRVDTWTAVVVATFDRGSVATTLVGSGYERAGTYRDLDLFARSDGPRAVALGDGTLAWSAAGADGSGGGNGEPPLSVVRRLFDAKAGKLPRHHETDAGQGFETLTDATRAPLDGRLFVGADDFPVPGWEFEDLDGWARGVAFDREYTYLRTVFAFAAPKDPDRLVDRIRGYAADREFYRTVEAVDVTAGERWAAVVAAVADGDYADRFGAPTTPVTYPQITWGYEHDPAAETVTVTHRGGDEVPAGTLHVDAATPPSRQFADEYDVVGPDDSLTVGVSPTGRGRITVVWRSPAGDVVTTIGRYEVPSTTGGR